MNHFPLVTEEEFRELQRAGIVGDAEVIFPLQRTEPLKRNKVYKGSQEDKEKALKWFKGYLLTLIPKIVQL